KWWRLPLNRSLIGVAQNLPTAAWLVPSRSFRLLAFFKIKTHDRPIDVFLDSGSVVAQLVRVVGLVIADGEADQPIPHHLALQPVAGLYDPLGFCRALIRPLDVYVCLASVGAQILGEVDLPHIHTSTMAGSSFGWRGI